MRLRSARILRAKLGRNVLVTLSTGVQLREKQRAERMYGLLEKQFRGYYTVASAQKGITGENLLRILESRLDNVVYRLGFAKSRDEARQVVRHGHITVNDRRVDIPSYRVRPNEVVAVATKSKDLLVIKTALIASEKIEVPGWLEVDIEKLQGKVLATVARSDRRAGSRAADRRALLEVMREAKEAI